MKASLLVELLDEILIELDDVEEEDIENGVNDGALCYVRRLLEKLRREALEETSKEDCGR